MPLEQDRAINSIAASSSSFNFFLWKWNTISTISLSIDFNPSFKGAPIVLCFLLSVPVAPLFKPTRALFLFLYLIPHALQRVWKHHVYIIIIIICPSINERTKPNSTKGKWIWIISWSIKWNFTLGPAGPPLHNGVVVVWQSVQLLLGGAMLLWFMCSASDPCFQKSRLAKLASYTLMNELSISVQWMLKNIRRWMALTFCLWSMILDTASSYFSGFMFMRRIKGQRNQNGWWVWSNTPTTHLASGWSLINSTLHTGMDGSWMLNKWTPPRETYPWLATTSTSSKF